MIPSVTSARMDRLKTEYPFAWQELSATLETIDEQEQQDLLLLYTHLDCHDVPSVSPEDMLSYVRASQKARQLIAYACQVPEELYAGYVLAPRVNNEWLDCSREWLLEELYSRVKDLDMMAAALEVNYWCYEKATYQPTDDRTIAPAGMCRRTYGRCGEESTLLVCALRAVGIPARQCYAPYWAHCDDNHAWVEFWAEDDWHYLGACEPEPTADRGWFRAAASKAMLIRSRVPDPAREEGYGIVNTTSRYAKTTLLCVRVTENGQLVPGVQVRFQLINYSRIQTLHSCRTDTAGIACMETGLGSLLVSASLDGIYVEKTVDLQKESFVELQKEDGIDPWKTEAETVCIMSVPREIIPEPDAVCPQHLNKLRQCEAVRERYASGFYSADSRWLAKSRGNWKEIERFLTLDVYTMAEKESLLETLTDKDFCDCTCEVLESYLRSALAWKERYPPAVWQWEILAPRVEHEMLLNIRPELETLLAGLNPSSPQQVLDWMERNLRVEAEYGLTDRRGNAAGYVRNQCCPESEWDILAVQICRALGIPAALSAQTGRLPLLQEKQLITLTLKNHDQPMTEEEHFSLSRWNGETYIPVHLNGCTICEEMAVSLESGAYCLVMIRRQIDGSINAAIHRFSLRGNREVPLRTQPDLTRDKLIYAPLPQISMSALTKNAADVALRSKENPSLLIFLEPGKEPTEHLLQEMISLEDKFRGTEVPICFLLHNPKELDNPTLSMVLKKLPASAAYLYDERSRFAVQTASGIGDGRLPLALVVDGSQRIVYGCANYNIRTAAMLLRVLSFVD